MRLLSSSLPGPAKPAADPSSGAMSIKAPENGREQRAELTKQAIADIVRARIVDRRFRQTAIVRASGISRTHLRSLVRGEKQMSVFILLELSEALGFNDACQLLRFILDRRDQRLRDDAEQHIPR